MRSVVGLLAFAAVAVVPTSAAHACNDLVDNCQQTPSASIGDGDPWSNVGELGEQPGAPASSTALIGTGPAHPMRCKIYLAEDAEGTGDVPSELDPATITPGTEVWQNCVDLVTNEIISSGAYTWGAGQTTPYVPPRVLAQQARAQLPVPIPSTRTWPAADQQVVRVPTWLRVDNFEAGSRTASLGGVSATVSATPVSALWDMGNGETVECSTAGAAFDPGSSDPTLVPACSFTFEHTSARADGGTFTGSVTVTWKIDWSSNVGAGGDLGTITRTAPIAWRVEQIQSLITAEGTR